MMAETEERSRGLALQRSEGRIVGWSLLKHPQGHCLDPTRALVFHSKMGSVFCSILELVLAPKWSPKWSQNRSKIGPQRVYNLVVFFFFSYFGRSRSSSGASWEPSGAFEPVSGGRWTLKTLKNCWFFNGFWKVTFSLLESS